MTQRNKEQRINYKLDETIQVDQNEIKIYNVPFAGNSNTCREVFVKGDRVLEFNISGDLTLDQLAQKPVFRDELVEYLYSISRQLVSMVHNGLKLEKVVFDLKYMYVRLSDFSIQLIYLPFEKVEPMEGPDAFIRCLLNKMTYAHTSALECANQIIDYLNSQKEFNVIQFNLFVKELRLKSQLLLIAEEAARNADIARMQAESEAKRLTAYAKQQAKVAKTAEEMRMLAEAARIQAEINRQKAEKEYRDQSQTAVLYACQVQEQSDDAVRKEYEEAKLRAETAARKAEEEFRKASAESERLAEEVRAAREEEMRAEEARMRAEYEARRNYKEAEKQEKEARRRNEEIGRLSETRQTNRIDPEEDETVVLTNVTEKIGKIPVLIRKKTGEQIYINKQAFCIGKADQGVDFKITDNKSVSRRHAYITNINGIYYLRDNNSTNHTYLNGDMVYSNVEIVIPDNSSIRLSNEEFLFKMN